MSNPRAILGIAPFLCIVAVLAGALTITGARAQTPDSVQACIDTLSFKKGFPSEETARKLFDELEQKSPDRDDHRKWKERQP